MTTIVADHYGMAADSQMTDEKAAVKSSVPKFWRIKGWLIGGAGDYSGIIRMIAELKAHKDLSPFQVLTDVDIKMQKDSEVELLMLSPSGKLYHSENGGHPLPSSDKFAAVGSGAQGALVAMNLGCTPKEAVAAVKKVDPSTGGRIITRKLLK
jgi:ATP-dependent protease HslVU (ClpYQ) peptidase subunit